jgi:hypothetical protein
MYDAGHRHEAGRIANAIFVLLGPDMRNHKSILSQLGSLDGQLTIPSTADSRGPHGTALNLHQFAHVIVNGGGHILHALAPVVRVLKSHLFSYCATIVVP